MDLLSRNQLRICFALVILVAALFLLGTNLGGATEEPHSRFQTQADRPVADRTPLAEPRDGITVVTSHLEGGNIVALAPNGTLLYHDDTHDGYWDVDPSPEGATTVVYSATEKVYNTSVCEPVDDEEYCIRQLIERANLTTGETTVLYTRIDPRYHSSEWHDVDRLNESHFVVADMYSDAVFIVDVRSGIVTWEWNLQSYLPLTTGGPYPGNWAHLNDVEVLADGRIMVSLRNQDQVVFLDREHGVVENWTLGADDRHSVLYEQHNPDYIPEANGGPAVVVADSENNRIVEYQRTAAGMWNRTWVWQDSHLQWPRDADRLPNHHTLVTDSHGGRVLEVDRAGEVVWRFEVPVAYEAERLVTGDESAGGPSATRAGLKSRSQSGPTADESRAPGQLKAFIKGLFPSKVVNGVAYVTPVWVGLFDLVVLLVGVITAVLWFGLEFWWSAYRVQMPITRG